MHLYNKLFLFVILLLITNNASAQSNSNARIDSLMKQYSQDGTFNGNLLVAKNNKVIYNQSFGFSDETKNEKLTAEHRFNLGSITKEFSAVALLQLKEQGKLNLTDKVSKFLPELGSWANEVSMCHLLNYTSGIPNVNWKQVTTDEDLFNGLMQVDSLNFKPGTEYDYNNNNIFLRQFIVNRITGIPFKIYAEKSIFQPCEMNSSVLTPFTNEKLIAKGFNNNLVQDKPDLPFTGGTYSTAKDLLQWTKCLHSEKIINKQSLFEIGQQFNEEDTQSALGNAKYKNGTLIKHSHHGRAGSYEALLVSDIDKKLTIILLTNNHNGKVSEIANAISTILNNSK